MRLEEVKSKHIACVYCLDFPNGKKYVGKTKDLCDRMDLYSRFGGSSTLNEAISEFGLDSIDVSVIREVKCDDKIDLELCLSILEVKYIRDLNTLVPNGYNISIGGECLGIPIDCITTDSDVVRRYNDGSKAVLLYDERGDFVREYASISKCSYDNGWDDDAVRNAIGKHSLFYGKYFLRFKRYDYAPSKIELPKGYEVRERVKYKNVVKEVIVEKERQVHTFTAALKYDMNGKFCGEYRSKREALRSFTKSCRVGWGEYHNGYIIFKKGDYDYPKQIESYVEFSNKQIGEYYVPAAELPDIEIHRDWDEKSSSSVKRHLCVDGKYTNIKHKFKVYQLTTDGEIIGGFDSIRDASHETGIAYSQIYNCLRGQTRVAAGYLWRKDGDEMDVKTEVKKNVKKIEEKKPQCTILDLTF